MTRKRYAICMSAIVLLGLTAFILYFLTGDDNQFFLATVCACCFSAYALVGVKYALVPYKKSKFFSISPMKYHYEMVGELETYRKVIYLVWILTDLAAVVSFIAGIIRMLIH